MKKLFLSIFISILILANNAFATQFDDIPYDFWAYEQIDKLSDEGLITGYEDNTFRPQKYVTRAEYCVFLIKTLGLEDFLFEKMYSFEDVDNNYWARSYILKAINFDLIEPTNDNYFYPDDYITRKEIITFMVNILKSERISKKDAIIALQNTYADFDDIPDWFKERAGKAEILGIIPKDPELGNYLDSEGYVTRAQMAVYMYNLKEKSGQYKKEKEREIFEEESKGTKNIFPDDIQIIQDDNIESPTEESSKTYEQEQINNSNFDDIE